MLYQSHLGIPKGFWTVLVQVVDGRAWDVSLHFRFWGLKRVGHIRVFPKIRGTFLRASIIRIFVFWGLYWGPLILGNYHNCYRS